MRAAFFDVGNTLIGWSSGDDPWRPVVLKAIEREFGPRAWADSLYAADIRCPPPDDPYRQETNRWLAEWLTANAETLTDSEVERLRVALASPLERGLELLPGAADALRWCKAHGLAVVLVTDTLSRGDDEVRRDWEHFGLSGVTDHVVSSHSTGWMKPHPAMYRRALALARAEASEAFMVGDQYLQDVIGAKQLGMRAVWKRSHGAVPEDAVFRPDGVITSLEELPDVLEPWLR